MSARQPQLSISSGPFLHTEQSTTRIMAEVLVALVPVVVAAVWFFGVTALFVVAASTAGATATEWLFRPDRRGPGTLADGSGVLTGALLGLTLPPAIPLWLAFLGGVVGIGLGKLIWGGLGYNLFNPALLGRAFLQTSFPVATTTWTAPGGGWLEISGSTWTAPFLRPAVDAVSSATPLGLAKFDGIQTELWPLLIGNVGGCLGETSALLIAACGVVLAARRVFDWRLCVSTLASVALWSSLLYLVDPGAYPTPPFMLLSGGLMFGAVFMATDPVTTPLTSSGAWFFGLGTGFLVVLIRVFGGLPESVMFAILIMNALTPHINRWCQPRPFQS